LGEVKITEATYEGRPQHKIETDSATYFLDRAGGGFSRMVDRDGNDWIAFHKDPLKEFPRSAAAGYRGIPNMLFGPDNPVAGGGHPGFDLCQSLKLNDRTIQVQTLNGKWTWEWEFTDQHATLNVTKVEDNTPYWFLYEGPVGGKWSPATHYFGTDRGGPRFDQPDNSNQLFEHWRWVYFGDAASKQVLLAAQLDADDVQDTLWYLGNSKANLDSPDGMIVFGFGRGPKSQPLLRGADKKFRIGFVESVGFDRGKSADFHAGMTQRANSWIMVTDENQSHSPKLPTISVRDETLFGDMECFRIETPVATYLYGKQGAGFASILDAQGNDWISYRHGNKAAGEYRGLPKCGQPNKFFHCGYGFGQYKNENPFVSEVIQQLPNHVRIQSETKDGKSQCVWDFYPTHATLTLNKIGNDKYWFLYEGTPGGKLDSQGDYVVRPGNRRTSLDDPWVDNVPWVYFGAAESSSSFFLINHQDDPGPESYVSWPYRQENNNSLHEMTVFGFGRPGWQDPAQHTPPLEQLPARFSIGFASSSEYETVEKEISTVVQRVAVERSAKRWRGPQPAEGIPWPENAHLFHRSWFQMGNEFFNPPINNRFRVNDPYAATHPNFHHRSEPRGNGLMLLPMNHSLPTIQAARLYLELWGGHPHTSNRRVTVNGRTTYPIVVPVEDQCTHAYPYLPIKITDLVRGPNALQFNVDGDQTFWGHFIVEEAAIDTLLSTEDKFAREWRQLSPTPPKVIVNATQTDAVELSLDAPQPAIEKIARVHYFAIYDGFDENGDGRTKDWHGMTKRKVPLGHIGTAQTAPYLLRWDTSMLTAQTGVQVRALIEFANVDSLLLEENRLAAANHRYWKAENFYLQTASTEPFSITHPAGVEVTYVSATNLSTPMWSRANQKRKCEFVWTNKDVVIERAQMSVCVWDGGAGQVKEYFKFNGHPLSVAADGKHDVILSQVPLEPTWIATDKNQVDLLSDTEHHGIEVLHPGPMLSIRYTSPQR
jgi:hypothetical protein